MKGAEQKTTTVEQVSAGGVAYRSSGQDLEIALILTDRERRWQVPKGLVDPGETPGQAATREVREEAGIETELIDKIDRTEYWFMADRDGARIRIHKYVHWFLMKYLSGDVADHDREVAEARWVSAGEALKMLAFKNEREMVEKAIELIRKRAD